MFHQGLNLEVFTKLVCWDDEASIDPLIDLTIRLDHLLQNRNQHLHPSSPVLTLNPSEPIQIGSASLSTAKQERDRE